MNNIKKYIIPGVLVFVIAILVGVLFQKPSSHSTHTMDRSDSASEHNEHSGMQGSELAQKYEIEITSDMNGIKPGVLKRVTYKIKSDSADSVKNFAVVHEKIMHLIVVREDLQDFQHLHPEYDSNKGEFTIDITFNKPGPYKLYADFTPANFDNNKKTAAIVSETTVNVGSKNQYKSENIVKTASPSVQIEDYEVNYTIDPPTEKGITYILSITKNGQPVKDLQPYLGAMGHSVLINTKTLKYYHTHAGDMHNNSAMDMTKASKGPNILFSAPVLEKGLYKTFTQFQHEENVITSEYVFEVK